MSKEEDKLKALVLRRLENTGVLSQIRAQLRQCVYEAIDDDGPAGENGFHNNGCNTLQGKTANLSLDLVLQFLERRGFEKSANILRRESESRREEVPKTVDLLCSDARVSREEVEEHSSVLEAVVHKAVGDGVHNGRGVIAQSMDSNGEGSSPKIVSIGEGAFSPKARGPLEPAHAHESPGLLRDIDAKIAALSKEGGIRGSSAMQTGGGGSGCSPEIEESISVGGFSEEEEYEGFLTQVKDAASPIPSQSRKVKDFDGVVQSEGLSSRGAAGASQGTLLGPGASSQVQNSNAGLMSQSQFSSTLMSSLDSGKNFSLDQSGVHDFSVDSTELEKCDHFEEIK